MLHEIHKEIISDEDPKFTSNFWKGLFKDFGAYLNFITSYHPKTNGQREIQPSDWIHVKNLSYG
jgi:hypothetical protein